jgi:hypothetical protein
MMSAERLARLAYSAMAESVHRIQLEVIQQEAINKRFGDDALPVSKILRGSKPNNLLERRAYDQSASLKSMVEDYLEAMRELEKLFEIQEKEDMEAFAKAWAARFRADQAAEKKRKK